MRSPAPPIHILGIKFHIEFFDSEEIVHADAIARCYKHSHVLKVNPHLEGVPYVEALMHEITHAAFHLSALSEAELSEELIAYCSGVAITSVISDERNAPFMAYITEQLSV